jgi:hypothetical protein
MDHKTFSKKGGSVKSEAKTLAARNNWKKAQEALKRKREEKHSDSGQVKPTT